MALTLLVEQELGEVGLIDLFEKSRAIWASLAQDAYDYTVKTYPPGATIRHDDVAKALTPVLSVHPTLVDFLRVEKIRGGIGLLISGIMF